MFYKMPFGKLKQIIISSVSVLLAILVFMGIAIVYAWTEPSLAPPGGNVSAPLNVGNVGQSKSGGLILNTGGATYGLIVDNGNVGIGTTGPNAKLTLSNNVAIGGLDTYGEYQLMFYDTGTPATSYGMGIRNATLVFNSDLNYNFDVGGVTKVAINNGNLDVSTNKIVNVAVPTGNSDAATKGYVDAQAGGSGAFSLKCGWTTTEQPPGVGYCTPSSCPAGFQASTVGCAATGISCPGVNHCGQSARVGVSGYCERICYK